MLSCNLCYDVLTVCLSVVMDSWVRWRTAETDPVDISSFSGTWTKTETSFKFHRVKEKRQDLLQRSTLNKNQYLNPKIRNNLVMSVFFYLFMFPSVLWADARLMLLLNFSQSGQFLRDLCIKLTPPQLLLFIFSTSCRATDQREHTYVWVCCVLRELSSIPVTVTLSFTWSAPQTTPGLVGILPPNYCDWCWLHFAPSKH